MQSESLVQFLPLPLTRKSWANSVNFCCLIYKTTIKRAHPSPIPDHNAMSGSVYISLGPLEASCPSLTMDRGSKCEAPSPSLIPSVMFLWRQEGLPSPSQGPRCLGGWALSWSLGGAQQEPPGTPDDPSLVRAKAALPLQDARTETQRRPRDPGPTQQNSTRAKTDLRGSEGPV